jgi:hypothetical protein
MFATATESSLKNQVVEVLKMAKHILFLLKNTFIFSFFACLASDFAKGESLSSKCQKDASLKYPTVNSVEKFEGNQKIIHWELSELSPQTGSEVEIVRCLPPGKYITVSRATVVRFNGNAVEAIEQESQHNTETGLEITPKMISQANLSPAVMVGDIVLEVQTQLSKSLQISPKVHLNMNDLFLGSSFISSGSPKLSEKGKQILDSGLAKFKGKFGVLMVEARMNVLGERKIIQTLSEQRAYEVVQYLRSQDANLIDKIEWVAYGSNEVAPGFYDIKDHGNEYITLRLKPNSL